HRDLRQHRQRHVLLRSDVPGWPDLRLRQRDSDHRGDHAPPNDGQDTFTVNQLQTMDTSRPYTDASGMITRRDTLDLDGQAGADTYVVNTTGSASSQPSDYVINVLDTGASTTDGLTINNSDAADLFLLRRASYLTGHPGADTPAFVAL